MLIEPEERLGPPAGSWYSRWLFERALALIYFTAFLVAVNQFVPLLGEHGLLPVSEWVRQVPFRASPSLFYLFPTDTAFRAAAWLGVTLSAVAVTGLASRAGSLVTAAVWALLWLLYLSFVNVGQTFYGFGWETLLLETGFLAIFLGGRTTEPGVVITWLLRWLLFRLMFGAGLIKWRGDPCWLDLTCLDYYFETQPMPNPLTWHFHWLPAFVHRAGVIINHIVEIGVPFLYFARQPFAAAAGLVTIAFQLILIVSGNLSWLNWLTIVLAIATFDDRWLAWIPVRRPPLRAATAARRAAMYVLALVVGLLSVPPTLNMLSPAQVMNTSFEPLHLVNTYGAFGSITRERLEIVIEGTEEREITDATRWREYEFKGKPGDPSRMPMQFAPYHLRLDWLMWFAAMSHPSDYEWFVPFLVKLLQGDPDTLGLLRSNPFPDRTPHFIRAQHYRYRLTTPSERRSTARWWSRELIGPYYPAISLRPNTAAPRIRSGSPASTSSAPQTR
jgi:hypothetical protein